MVRGLSDKSAVVVYMSIATLEYHFIYLNVDREDDNLRSSDINCSFEIPKVNSSKLDHYPKAGDWTQ